MEETFFFSSNFSWTTPLCSFAWNTAGAGFNISKESQWGRSAEEDKKEKKNTKITKKKKSAVETKPLRDIDILCRRRAASRPAPAY